MSSCANSHEHIEKYINGRDELEHGNHHPDRIEEVEESNEMDQTGCTIISEDEVASRQSIPVPNTK